MTTYDGQLADADAREALREMADMRAEIDQLREALKGASHALRSYQYGNASTELAASIADRCDAVLRMAKP